MKPLSLILVMLTTAVRLAAGPFAEKITREEIAGFDVLVYPTQIQEVVYLAGSLPAGSIFNPPDNPMIAALVAGMLDKGTTLRDKFAIANELEALGATVSFGSGTHRATFSARCLKSDLPAVIRLLAEQLRSPAFDPAELAKLKTQIEAGIERGLDNPEARAAEVFSRAIYPAGHPNRLRSADERRAGLKAATVDDLRAFHAEYYGPDHAILVATGDIDAAALHAAVAQAFAGWRGKHHHAPKFEAAGPAGKTAEETITIPGKASVQVLLGHASGLRFRHKDALPLQVGTAILGSGFTSRLMGNVRDKEGLTYGINAATHADTFADGEWRISATFAPELLAQGVASTRRQFARWIEQGVTGEEVAARKTNLLGQFENSLATSEGINRTILSTLHRGLPLTWLDEYPARLHALTVDEVNAAIRNYVRPDSLVLVQAGTFATPVAEATK